MEANKPHILVVDDDASIRELLASYLEENQIRVTAVATGEDMSRELEQSVIDLVMLDLRLANEDGMVLARQLREGGEVPVIIVSGVQDEADRVMGLEIGADDYIVKPFSSREVLARVRAVLRRYQARAQFGLTARPGRQRAFRFSGFELNLRVRRLKAPDGTTIELSNGEFNLLVALCEAPQRVLPREQLLDLSRLHGAEVYDRSIDVQILRLRRKIEVDPATPKLIRTERGAGYVFATPVDVLA